MNNGAVFTTPVLGLWIEPIDTLFFRDGRPFSAADRGRSGIPSPQTLAGMIKTRLIRHLGLPPERIHHLRHHPEDPRAWITRVAVRGPWLAARKEPGDSPPSNAEPNAPPEDTVAVETLFFPSPAHLVQFTPPDGKEEKFSLLRPILESSLPGWKCPSPTFSDMRPVVLGEPSDGKIKTAGGYLSLEGLSLVLKDQTPAKPREPLVPPRDASRPYRDKEWVRESDLFVHEERTGIGIDGATQTAEVGLIYSASHLRLRPGLGFYAEIGWEPGENNAPVPKDTDLLDALPPEGVVLPFGGEGRRVLVKPARPLFTWPESPATPPPEEGGFSTLLISPAVFGVRNGNGKRRHESAETGKTRPGWQPPDLGRLVGAVVSKPMPVSGWDLGGSGRREQLAAEEGGGMDPASPEGLRRGNLESCEVDPVDGMDTGGDDVPADRGRPGIVPPHPRPTRFAVPPGSVYFWRNGANADASKTLPSMCQLAERLTDRAAGWGIALKGIWKYEQDKA